MGDKRVTRRLAAIVVADVVGYSRMMEGDESGTLEAIEALHAEVIAPQTERFGGRIVKTMGDGWLAEFPSVTDAVASCLDIQAKAAGRSVGLPEDRRLVLRVGVSLGEIIHAGDDVYGTGVNLAARLESIAKPGGVCVSDWVFEQIRGVFDLPHEDMGLQNLKNLSKPIRAFMVYPGDGKQEPGSPSVRLSAHAPEPRASIAVLPFENLSNDDAQEYFVDGMVDDILTALSRFKWLAVIARQSSFAYKGRSVDVRQIGNELGVRYVLEGSVRKSDARVRITGQLIDATSGSHLWADHFEGDLEQVFELQDRLTENVVGLLEPQIRKAEIERARRARPENLDAYDLFLRALPHAYAMRPEDNAKALEYLDEAIRLDPGYIPAQAFAAWCYEQRLTRGWPDSTPTDAEVAVGLARSTLAANTDDANAISIAGFVLVMVGHEYTAGLAALHRAVELNPHNAFVLMNAGWMEVFAGDLATAFTLFQRARSISPNDPVAFFVITGLAMTSLLAMQWEEAAELAAESASVYGEWDATYFVLAVALALAGRVEEARTAASRFELLTPADSSARYLAALPIRDPERRVLLEQGMTRAGLPA